MHARSRGESAAHVPHAARAPLREPLELAVLGAGSWGTALAAASRRAGLSTRLWSRRPDVAHAIRTTGCNPRHLPGIALPEGLQASDDLEWVLQGADVVLFAVPCGSLREVAGAAAGALPPHALALAACKGVEPGTGELMTQVLRESCAGGQPVGMLAGPSFADEVVRGLPTRLTLGMRAHPAASVTAAELAKALRAAAIELELCDDEIGVQVAGALKNPVAIACGMASAQGLGENARAAIVARGLEDMRRLTVALGGRGETLFRSSGVGDLFLTASSSHSRNTRLGMRLGASAAHRAGAQAGEGGELTEGASASQALAVLERRLQLALQVPRAVRDVLAGRCTAARALQRVLEEPQEPQEPTAQGPTRVAAHAAAAHGVSHDGGAVRVPGAVWNHRAVQ
ncbi:NAD(P)H-dependent glycerol-3-phosphate dehydrogenase [Thiomonas sp.]|jgi:glycerol-3-phosphate dehydrogenase (NAD(P)+)|uniref:NAD(P)H-dependent glycerol-3-phosphate dehydrogenase n=1 Tax=Thiomonas sp. TaxID=2047785 RepID=UPI0026360805|nr:NAD(P)H-dependent glycerol-3-phosphate dehydrogenase [Thiomonas sp.]